MHLAEIEKSLNDVFITEHLEVINESGMHSVPKGSLTHIKVIVVSEKFKAKSLLERHQAVYNCLTLYMQQGLHAVSVFAYTPEEWQTRLQKVPPSPPCQGGRKKEQDN